MAVFTEATHRRTVSAVESTFRVVASSLALTVSDNHGVAIRVVVDARCTNSSEVKPIFDV
jgi:hypothetical protein